MVGTGGKDLIARITPTYASDGANVEVVVLLHSMEAPSDYAAEMESILNAMEIVPIQIDAKGETVFVFGRTDGGFVMTRLGVHGNLISQFILATNSEDLAVSSFDAFTEMVNGSGFLEP